MNETNPQRAGPVADTIAAIATAPGRGCISVVRVSGPNALPIADHVFRGKGRIHPSAIATKGLLLGHLYDSQRNKVIDEVVLLVMRSPHSYTTEDTVEIQGHGGSVMAQAILETVLNAGARMAEPGEFTKRAFLNGRIDLTQAEAVADLVVASSGRAAAVAIEQLEGTLGAKCNAIYDQLLNLSSDVEATLDFEEDTLPPLVRRDLEAAMQKPLADIRALMATWREGKILRDGLRVVIAGQPNAGKSSLMNILLGSERSIVHPTPGTTRDAIEESMDLNGYLIRLIDTAGLRDSTCEIENKGMALSRKNISTADVVLYVVDGSDSCTAQCVDMQRVGEMQPIVVVNKMDLGINIDLNCFSGLERATTCLLRGDGVEDIKRLLTARIEVLSNTDHTGHATISERHLDLLKKAEKGMSEAIGILTSGSDKDIVLAARNLRDAAERMGSITGKVYTDDLLNSIFSKFCIGK